MYFPSWEKSYSLDDESDDDGSVSGSSGMCFFPLRFDNYVGHVSGLGYVVFVTTRVDSKCGVFAFIMFVPIGVKSKVG